MLRHSGHDEVMIRNPVALACLSSRADTIRSDPGYYKSDVFLTQSTQRNAEETGKLGKGSITIIAMFFHHRVIEDTEKV
jgi:hypothetical protein